jgi:hypothetical protein
MGFFGTKPVITKREADEMINRLRIEHNFPEKKAEIVRELIKPHLSDAENYGDPEGVSPKEVKEIDESLNRGDVKKIFAQDFSDPEKQVVEKMLEDYLKLRR